MENLLRALDAAYRDSLEPPPHYREPGANERPTGLDSAQIEKWRNELQAQTRRTKALGRVLCNRRRAMGMDIDDLAAEAHWAASRLEKLEEGELGLNDVDPELLAHLLASLKVTSIGPLEPTIRDLARKNLAVYEKHKGQIYGRSRKGVTARQRHEDLMRGVAGIDEEATARAADRYLKAVQTELESLKPNRSS